MKSNINKDSKINDALYPHIKEKVASLYSIFKNDDNIERQRLAQWALTYFFDDEDIIHIHDMGYVSGPISNCELVNLEDMLQNGTVITDTLIEKPHSFSTASMKGSL